MALFHHLRHTLFLLVAVAGLTGTLAIGILQARPARVAASGTTVLMAGSSFGPNDLVITAGDTVTWTNDDAAVHDVTSLDGDWSSGILQPGASFSHTFDSPGTYTYNCSLHPFMAGTVVVQPASDS